MLQRRALLALPALLLAPPALALPRLVDARGGELRLSARAMGFMPLSGRFASFQASVSETGIELRAETASLDMSLPGFEGRLQSPEWLDVAAHPEARFLADGPLRPGVKEMRGALTLRGVTQPFLVRLAWPDGERGGSVDAEGRLSRAAYGMVADQGLVGDAISLILSVRRQIQ
jgi:polyisoprenoid-binding protein YceI